METFYLNYNPLGYRLVAQKRDIVDLEPKRRKILNETEATWGLNIKSIWLKKGDDNIFFFHDYVNHINNVNSLWHMEDEDGSMTIGLLNIS